MQSGSRKNRVLGRNRIGKLKGLGIHTRHEANRDRDQIEFLYLHYPVGATAGQPYTHAGEECGLVLEGTFKGVFGDREVVLEAGDSVYYDSSIPHYWENAGDVDVRAIWAITPPSF